MSSSHTPNAYVQYLNMIHEMIMDMTCALTVMANDHALDRHQMMALRDELRAQVCSDYRLFPRLHAQTIFTLQFAYMIGEYPQDNDGEMPAPDLEQ